MTLKNHLYFTIFFLSFSLFVSSSDADFNPKPSIVFKNLFQLLQQIFHVMTPQEQF